MIYLIITTCIENKHGVINDDFRKQRYLDCINQTLTLLKNHNSSIIPIIVENNGLRKTYLDIFDCDILYTNHNESMYKHKGVNELNDIKEVISHYNIQEHDMIIKLTGRYKLLDLSFIHMIECNPNVNAFIKFYDVYSKSYKDNDCVLGLFAITCKYLNHFNYDDKDSSEREFAKYVNEHVPFVMKVDQLSLECCLGDDLSMVYV